MAKFPPQYLRTGRALCHRTAPNFVDTFNGLVDFARNLKGDAELRRDGRILVDRTIPGQPVIRFTEGGAGGAGDFASGRDLGCFRLVYREGGSDGDPYLTVVNRYWSDGEICAHIDEEATINLTDMAAVDELPMIALKVPAAGQSAAPEVVGYANFESMVLAQHDQAFAIQPLYLFKVEGMEVPEDSDEEPKPIISVECDFRNIPKLQLAELL